MVTMMMKHKIKTILLLTLSVFFTASAALCVESSEQYDFIYAEDETIFKETTWYGTVLIKGVVTVYEEATLTIEPGTTIMFEKKDTMGDGFGENEMYIRGEIVAEGTKDKPITFTSAEKVKRPGDWVAINMMVSEEKRNIFRYCILEYSMRGFHAHFSDMNLVDCNIRYNFLGVQFQDSKVKIDRCRINSNNQGMQFRDSTLIITDSSFSDNNIGIRSVYSTVEFLNNSVEDCNLTAYQIRGSKVHIAGSKFNSSKTGIAAQDSELYITGSYINDNMQDGLSLHNSEVTITNNYIILNGDDGVLIENCDGAVNSNIIYNNAKYNMYLDQEDDFDAKGNYWGTDNIDRLEYFNYDKLDDSSLGKIINDNFYKTEKTIIK